MKVKNSDNEKTPQYAKYVRFDNGVVRFVGDFVATRLSFLLGRMDDAYEDFKEYRFQSISSRELLNKLEKRYVFAMEKLESVSDELSKESFEKKKNCNEIIIDRLMYLYGRFEWGTYNMDPDNKRVNGDILFAGLYEVLEAGKEIIEETLAFLYDIEPYFENQRDVYIEDTQNGFRVVTEKECPVNTQTIHAGFYDVAHHKLLKKEEVLVHNVKESDKELAR